jgi:hypothetical protein
MKPTRILSATSAALLITALLVAMAPAAKATTFPDLQYNVTLNLSSLNLLPNAPFSLDLQLVTGSAAANVTNTVTLSNFVFTGGTASGTPDYTNGNESGSLASSVVLTTGTTPVAQEANEFAEAFSSGVTSISFHVDQTPNSELVSSGTPIPDQFNVAILDNGLNNVPTTDPSGAANDTYTLVSSAISSSETASNVNYYTIVATPEPSSTALSFVVAGGLLGLVLLRRRSA